MSVLSGWVLSVVGIVVLGVLIDIAMPEGQMNKYIKGVFGILTVFVIVAPITQIFNMEIDFDEFLYNSTATQIDSDYLEATQKLFCENAEYYVEKQLENGGFSEVIVTIECNLEDSQFTITKVIVDIKKMVINANMVHINKYTEIKNIIMDSVTVKEDDIVFNE
jgi:stage III sporulation protein AF